MDDRELLELAAKAVNNGLWHPLTHGKPWNPLKDDGDALRLAVKLKMFEEGSGQFNKLLWNLATCVGPDEYKNTRLAIVRTAAEIGRSIP